MIAGLRGMWLGLAVTDEEASMVVGGWSNPPSQRWHGGIQKLRGFQRSRITCPPIVNRLPTYHTRQINISNKRLRAAMTIEYAQPPYPPPTLTNQTRRTTPIKSLKAPSRHFQPHDFATYEQALASSAPVPDDSSISSSPVRVYRVRGLPGSPFLRSGCGL